MNRLPRRNEQIHWYEYLRADVQNYYRAVEDSFAGEVTDLCRSITDWRRALWIAHSRAFALPPTGKEIALIPMVDMFNHVTRANSELVYNGDTNSYDIVSLAVHKPLALLMSVEGALDNSR
mmetsp:Transcript_10638/g.44330  ORF Transcript_10638/g.44330 Transcript_10638/m.44330 type:complete len:121 (-) Transcript_10638:2045-2407(-)